MKNAREQTRTLLGGQFSIAVSYSCRLVLSLIGKLTARGWISILAYGLFAGIFVGILYLIYVLQMFTPALALFTFGLGLLFRSIFRIVNLKGAELAPRPSVPAQAIDQGYQTAKNETILSDPNGSGRHAKDTGAIEPERAPALEVVPAYLDHTASELQQFGLFTKFLDRQLNEVMQLSSEAANNIISNLVGLDQKIQVLLAFIQNSSSNEHGVEVLEKMERGVIHCQGALESFIARQSDDARESRRQLQSIASETLNVLEVVNGVSGIARQTKMLAFNVAIEAARAGDAGRGFAVIGQQIRELSTEVQDLSANIHQRIQALVTSVSIDLVDATEQREVTGRSAIDHVGTMLSALTGSLGPLRRHQIEILGEIERGGEAIAGPILDMMGAVQFQDIIRQQIEQIVKMSDLVGNHIELVGSMISSRQDDANLIELASKLDGLYSQYVMNAQREVHQSVLGTNVTDTAMPRIQLF